MRTNPHILEINIRTWVNHLRQKYGAELSLISIPEHEWLSFKRLGFDAVWLMGAWTPSPAAREVARRHEPILKKIRDIYPDFKTEDVDASPYAVYDYVLNPALGKPEELGLLHEKLNSMGLKLILDFVSNHLAMDHRLVEECPECFIKGTAEDAEHNPGFFFKGPDGKTWYAHGRDPNFAPWTDTVQLNYFCDRARKHMQEMLLQVASVCDGVRCDMAMLTLNDIHRETWGWLLNRQGYTEKGEFWQEAIAKVREEYPLFTFLAEVYWGLEWHIQQLGFNYTYDKVLYDRLRSMGAQDVKGHLYAESLYQKRSLRFIDNHDEEASLTAFGRDKSIAAAIVMATLRGMRLFSHGQILGSKTRVPVQCLRDNFEGDPEIKARYKHLLKIADDSAYHGGEWTLVELTPVSKEDGSFRELLAWSWTQMRTIKYVVVNYSPCYARARLPIKPGPRGAEYTFFDEISDRFFTRSIDEVKNQGLFVELPPYSAHLLDLEF